ncbi:MAG TPA: GTPase ObgE [Candidatus Aminicenantes bacterium]|nr:GTPase ObgE [Candidatus Aminicenantes bacterium]HRY64050.1 GTPase ObgE [Candidatus Aminicenantes bacterium]HRZ70963.1 GTPase ObgE [Candidatus Aminicenantes bacterium]
MFVDQVTVTLKAGRGGNGCVSFRREARVPKGGPDGGHGGDGGSIVFVADENISSLAYFRFHPLIRAKNGAPGEGGNRQGKRGADVRLGVPVGTVIKESGGGAVLADLARHGLSCVAARGGRGGRGNASFATATHQTPREWQPGRPGEEKELFLELKLIADAGLVGFPNAGKSTLISRISAARPLIADYPFTTLTPNLGVVDIGEYRSFIVADIPGLIEGAHLGQGLGIRFLRHIERTKLLIHVLDVSPYSGRDPVQDFKAVMKELEAFSPEVAARPQILVANKVDLLGGDRSRLVRLRRLAARRGIPLFAVSALKGEGLKPLVETAARQLAELAAASGGGTGETGGEAAGS